MTPVRQRIGRYRLTQRIGAGAFATVWLAVDEGPGNPGKSGDTGNSTEGGEVAVKVLAENWALDEGVCDRFLKEARILAGLDDPLVVAVHGTGTLPDGRPWFAMDHCNAGSLADLTRLRYGLRPALELCAHACRAIEVLHRHGILHRDVSPSNLLLHRDPGAELRVRVADLGVARMLSGRATTMVAGTPAYMAIEQARGWPLDARADVYSLACLTHTVLTGRPPFPVRSLDDLLRREPDPIRDLAPVAQSIGAPSELDGLLTAALSPDPELRPGSAEILAQWLERFAAEVPREAMLPPRADP